MYDILHTDNCSFVHVLKPQAQKKTFLHIAWVQGYENYNTTVMHIFTSLPLYVIRGGTTVLPAHKDLSILEYIHT